MLLAQLAGTWEINKETFINVKGKNELYTLGVCENHFNFNQNTLHISNTKKLRSVEKSWIYHHHYIYFATNINIFLVVVIIV
jgi:hypothetical protein